MTSTTQSEDAEGLLLFEGHGGPSEDQTAPPTTTAIDLKVARREDRFKEALKASLGYHPITEKWFHPHPHTAHSNSRHHSGLEKEGDQENWTTDLNPERLLALIQHDFVSQNYLRIIHTSHHYILCHHHPHPNTIHPLTKHHKIQTSTHHEATKKLAIILESNLICFKKLWRSNPSLVFPSHPTISHSLLLLFLEWSQPFFDLVPSLGFVAADLFIRLGNPVGLNAIIPALEHSGSPRIHQILETGIMMKPENEGDPKSKARGLVAEILRRVSSNKTHLKPFIQHLGLSNYITHHPTISSPSTAPTSTSTITTLTNTDTNSLQPWSSFILDAFRETGMAAEA